MTRYEELISRKRREYGDKFDTSALAPQFVEAFNKAPDYRVAIPSPAHNIEEGKKAWGYVGVTTGWKPAFILMRSTRNYGSSVVLDSQTQILGAHFIK